MDIIPVDGYVIRGIGIYNQVKAVKWKGEHRIFLIAILAPDVFYLIVLDRAIGVVISYTTDTIF